MSHQSDIVQDEINIRELIETVWKGKVIIAIVTAIAITASVITSFFILSEKYEAEVTLMVSPSKITKSASEDSINIVDYLAKLPIMTKENYLLQVKSPQILEDTIKKLELKDSAGIYISARSLSRAITVTDVTDTNLIEIKVKYNDPEKAAQIANTLSSCFADYVAVNFRALIQQAADSIWQQLSNEETILIEKKDALNEYLSQNINIDVLKGEEANLVVQIVKYKDDLQEIEAQIASDTETLQILESASQSTVIVKTEDFNLGIFLNNDTGTVEQDQALKDQVLLNITPDSLQNALLTINISNIQTKLISNLTKKQALEDRIPELESTLTESQTLLTNEEYIYNAINMDMELAQLTYDAYQQKNKEVTTYRASDIGNTIIAVSSEATVPVQPVSSNKAMIITVSGMLGLCLSVFFVLFREYWKKSKVISPK